MRAIGKETYNSTLNYYDLDESDTAQEKRLRRVLKPVAALRRTKPKCCLTCEYLKPLDASAQCLRPDGPSFDVGDGYQYFTVCDGYKQDGGDIEEDKS